MEINNKIPIKSKNIEIIPFDNDEYIIKQTEYGHQINVNEDTLTILQLVDGKRNLRDIHELYGDENGVTPNLLDSLLFEQLAKYGIIETEKEVIKKIGKPSYLKLSFTLLKNNTILPIVKVLSPLFFRKTFYPLLTAFFLVVFGTLIFHFDSARAGLENLSFGQWVFYFLFAGIVLFFHEVGHATACHRFGAKFGDIGFGFYLLSPVMYADVSDIWKLKASKRVIVNLSGIYIELLIATILVIAYYITDANRYLAYSSVISLSLLSNLNPFLRYDGYWILSDLIGVPNLRRESNKVLSKLFRNNLSIKHLSKKTLFLALYALISHVLIFIVLAAIVTYDPNGLIFFPKNCYIYLTDIYNGEFKPKFSDVYQFLLPIIFYFIAISFIFTYVKNRQKKT